MFSSMKGSSIVAVVAAISLVCLAATAQAELVVNGDFASGLTNWTFIDIAGDGAARIDTGSSYDHPDDGTNRNMEMFVGDYSGTQKPGALQQNIGAALANTVYTLNWDGWNQTGSISGYGSRTSQGTIGLYWDNGGTFTSLGTSTWALPEPAWGSAPASTVTVGASDPVIGKPLYVMLTLVNTNSPYTGGGGWQAFDNISVTAVTTPEPGTIVLLATGLIGILCYAWRKQK
jgi:hypothetical protein